TNIWTVMTVTGFRSKWMGVIIDPLQKYGDAPRAARRPDVPPHGAQSAPWGPRRSGATTAERGPHRASCARWGAISGIFEGGATQSARGPHGADCAPWGGAGMPRRPNAAGVSPRAATPGIEGRDRQQFARRVTSGPLASVAPVRRRNRDPADPSRARAAGACALRAHERSGRAAARSGKL